MSSAVLKRGFSVDFMMISWDLWKLRGASLEFVGILRGLLVFSCDFMGFSNLEPYILLPFFPRIDIR